MTHEKTKTQKPKLRVVVPPETLAILQALSARRGYASIASLLREAIDLLLAKENTR